MFIHWIKIFFSGMHFAKQLYLENLSRAYIYIVSKRNEAFESDDWNRFYLIKSLNWFERSLSLSVSLSTQEPPVQVNLFKCRSIQKDDTHRHGGSSTSASLFSLLCHSRYDPFVSPPQKGRPEQWPWCTIREFVYKWRSASSFEDICWWNPSKREDFSRRGIKSRIHIRIFDK